MIFTLIIAALGYFVDVYDIVLFTAIRTTSLTDLGYSGNELAIIGTRLLNAQLIGMVIGGFIWGYLGDLLGRKSVMMSSILVYSLANLSNAFVHDSSSYLVLRFISGIGLAG